MAQRERKSRKNATKGKIVLIAVLVLVLIGVGYVQLAPMLGSADTTKTSHRRDRSSKLPKLPKKERVDDRKLKATKVSRAKPELVPQKAAAISGDAFEAWPKKEFSELKFRDPFQYPSELVRMKSARVAKERADKLVSEFAAKRAAIKAERERILKTIDRLATNGVEIAYIENDRRIAKIEGKFVSEGDMIEGVRILQIKDNGEVVIDVPDWPADVPVISLDDSKRLLASTIRFFSAFLFNRQVN